MSAAGLVPYDPARLRPYAPVPAPLSPTAPASPLGALVWRPGVRQRHAVHYLVCRAWSAAAKKADIRALVQAKRAPVIPQDLVQGAAEDLVRVLRGLVGPAAGWSVSHVATGHSQRPDALAPQIAAAVAVGLGLPHVAVWQDRYVSGSSHPKEFRRLPPLVWRERPTAPVLLVDDVATSGWHMHEALTALRASGVPALGIAWIGSTVTTA